MDDLNLQKKLDKLAEVFDINSVLTLNAKSPSNIASYYKTNKLAYKFFHSKTDFIHAGISEEQTYSEKDLFKQAEIIESYFTNATTKVLEIGCGKGRNLEYLAKRNSGIDFYGLDLVGGQTDIAINKANKVKNMYVEYGDYHNLAQLNDKKFDVVFVIEALCHSNDKASVAREVAKILNTNGLFIIFDGYLGVKINSLNKYSKKAWELVGKGMMVDTFEEYSTVKDKIIKQEFSLEKELDYSVNVLPTFYRFEKFAKLAFDFGMLSSMLIKLLPPNFKNNAISGYLIPDLIKNGIAKYYFSVFRKG